MLRTWWTSFLIKLTIENSLRWRSGHLQRNIIFIADLESLRAFQICLFTGGTAAANYILPVAGIFWSRILRQSRDGESWSAGNTFSSKGRVGNLHFADCLHLPVGAFLVKVCLERPAGRDKHEIKNKISAENAQSEAEGI